MENKLTIYNTLSRRKELFVPLHAPHVGMYVCGPTVYGDAHLGHARPAITFDILFRYLTHLGYKVRYVRNITDVGHLEHDADEGEDKIAKKARLEQLEPMEVVQYYLNRYHKAMEALPEIGPTKIRLLRQKIRHSEKRTTGIYVIPLHKQKKLAYAHSFYAFPSFPLRLHTAVFLLGYFAAGRMRHD